MSRKRFVTYESMGAGLVRRWITGLLGLAMMCLVTACGSKESSDISMQETYFSEDITETEPADRADGRQTSEHNKILIAYFTWAENARPKLVEKVSDLSEYDVVFLGYPNWWYSAPMAVFSFLEENDLSGKKVVLFSSHGTGGLASSVKDISAVLAKELDKYAGQLEALGANVADVVTSFERH